MNKRIAKNIKQKSIQTFNIQIRRDTDNLFDFRLEINNI